MEEVDEEEGLDDGSEEKEEEEEDGWGGLKDGRNSALREFCGKSDAAFGGCGFFGGYAPPKRVIPGSVRDLW